MEEEEEFEFSILFQTYFGRDWELLTVGSGEHTSFHEVTSAREQQQQQHHHVERLPPNRCLVSTQINSSERNGASECCDLRSRNVRR